VDIDHVMVAALAALFTVMGAFAVVAIVIDLFTDP
jgi:hypothetical protein